VALSIKVVFFLARVAKSEEEAEEELLAHRIAKAKQSTAHGQQQRRPKEEGRRLCWRSIDSPLPPPACVCVCFPPSFTLFSYEKEKEEEDARYCRKIKKPRLPKTTKTTTTTTPHFKVARANLFLILLPA
jgi:hypothetical protein